ncbi:hypothetical protein M407DRAFT_8892 [Tulasnella calospora MUT 4182]|uniref:Uncharacterized protein n=1 Tax=Tulasnella calospora MUT 4182 TaxID=1051891 RepID=A0A0C3Q5U3_9AGAM|nr:hypothetical protein M407DRAFT_8892 [Tulasnella calospora MUT 4182]
MAGRGANHNLYYCAHCRTDVSRTTLWRHQQQVLQLQQALQDEAFTASVDPEALLHHDQPPNSPGNISISMSEAALSSIHLSEISIDENPPPPLPVPASLPQPNSHPPDVNNALDATPDMEMMDVAEPPALTAEEIDEEIDEDILNLRNARRPPTLEEIYWYARYGIAADDNNEDNGHVGPNDDLLSQVSSRSSASDGEFDIPPGLDLEDEAEILAADANLAKVAIGTRAYDAVERSMFTLRVYSPLKCGDMPAVASAYSGGKHPGAEHPCRICPIEGI